ncbi:MAG: response regulator, partial [Bacteroidota bacterium]
MNAVIIEDNEDVQEIIQTLILKYFPEIESFKIANTITAGKQLILESNPQIAFLDVELPDGTSFELLQDLPNILFQPIFITAHEKYALKAIKFSALDYLLKPIDKSEFIEAAKKAIDK